MNKTPYAHYFNPHVAPQTQPIPGREADMQLNAAGGYGFAADDWVRLNRFLLIGTEGGTYYEGERELTLQNAAVVERCLNVDGGRTIDEIVRVSEAGLAPSNSPAIFALALCASKGDAVTRTRALDTLGRVCRTASFLFEFVATVRAFRGWGRGLRSAVADWYLSKDLDALAYQVVKYRNRSGMTHCDLLRLAHPATAELFRLNLFAWIVGKAALLENAPQTARAFEDIQAAKDKSRVLTIIRDARLPFEAVPYTWLADADVWSELLVDMPYTATLRHLGKMTSAGVIAPFSDGLKLVVERLTDQERIRKARVHPLALLKALKQYSAGHGDKGKLTWTPVRQVLDALNEAFYRAFDTLEPSGKRVLVALDCSGSMDAPVTGVANLSAKEAAAAVAMCYLRTEKDALFVGYGTSIGILDLSPSMRLDDVLRALPELGGTDCSLPAQAALQQHWSIDGLVMLTDSESWAGKVHAAQALDALRKQSALPVRLVNIQATANGTSIRDPEDGLSMEMAGFGPNIPLVANQFIRGEL